MLAEQTIAGSQLCSIGVSNHGWPHSVQLSHSHTCQPQKQPPSRGFEGVMAREGLCHMCMQLREELERHLGAGHVGELVREGVRVAIVGPPNAGVCAKVSHDSCGLAGDGSPCLLGTTFIVEGKGALFVYSAPLHA